MTAVDPEIRRLTELLTEVQDRLTAIERTNSMSNGSVLGSLDIYDVSGEQQAMSVGAQFDGTYVAAPVTGPEPPIPTAPTCMPALSAVSVRWDGNWEALYDADGMVVDDQVVAPMDFARVEIHAGIEPDFDPTSIDTLVGTFETPRGGETLCPLPTGGEPYYVRLVARSQAGKRGDPSDATMVTPFANSDITGGPTEAPASSPVPSVYGTLDGLLVTTDPDDVEPGTILDYHVSTTSGFTPSAATLASSSQSNVVVIAAMPDGTAMALDTPYYVVVVAHNAVGTAAPSAEVSGQLSADNASRVVAAKIVAGFILAGRIDVGNISIDPDTGITIAVPGGSIYLPANGIDAARFDGEITARLLDVIDNYTISGNGQLNGVFLLKSGINNPSILPTVSTNDWPSVRSGYTEYCRGMTPVISHASGGVWGSGPGSPVNAYATAVVFFGTGIRFVDPRDGAIATFPDPSAQGSTLAGDPPNWWGKNFYAWGGIAADPARETYWVFGQDGTRSGNWYWYAIDSKTFQKKGEVYSAPSSYWPADAAPKIAVYGNVAYLLHWSSANQLLLQQRTIGGTTAAPTLGAATNSAAIASNAARPEIGGFDVGIFDTPSAQLSFAWCYRDSGNWTIRLVSSVGTYPTGCGAWLRAGNDRVDGGCYHPVHGQFFAANMLTGKGRIYRHSGFVANRVIRASYSWYDPLDTAGNWTDTGLGDGSDGTHETKEGPYREFTVQCRSYYNVEVPSPPDAKDTSGNTDIASAARIYVGDGAGTRYRLATVGKSVRTVSVTLSDYPGGFVYVPGSNRGGDDLYGAVNTMRVASRGAFNTFTPDDVGATVTGTNIPAGTTIQSIIQDSNGQAVVLSQNHTQVGVAVVNVTITRAVLGKKAYQRSTIPTATPPPASNGFSGLPVVPGVIQATAEDANGPLISAEGDGNFRAGTIKVVPGYVRPRGILTHQANNTLNTGVWARLTGLGTLSGAFAGDITASSGAIQILEEGWYVVYGLIYHNYAATSGRCGTSVDVAMAAADPVSTVSAAAGTGGLQQVVGRNSGTVPVLSVSGPLYCPANSFVRLWAFQDSGTNFTLPFNAATHLKVVKMDPFITL